MKQARVLLVEDELRLQQVLKYTLVASGYAVEAVGTAADAVRCIMAARPDVLMLDINLPDGSGWGVLRDANHGAGALPTIVISADMPAREQMAEYQPLAFLPKPFTVNVLKLLIVKALAAPREVR